MWYAIALMILGSGLTGFGLGRILESKEFDKIVADRERQLEAEREENSKASKRNQKLIEQVDVLRGKLNTAEAQRDEYKKALQDMTRTATELTAERDKAVRAYEKETETSAALRKAIGLATTAKPSLVMDPDNPIGMMQEVIKETDLLRAKNKDLANQLGMALENNKKLNEAIALAISLVPSTKMDADDPVGMMHEIVGTIEHKERKQASINQVLEDFVATINDLCAFDGGPDKCAVKPCTQAQPETSNSEAAA